MPPTKPAHGVMATSPATAPDIAPSVVALPSLIRSTTSQPSMAAEAARNVFMIAEAATPSAARAEPALKPGPAEPQDAGADHRHRQVVRWHRVVGIALALPDQQHQRERRGTGVDVDDRTAGEVERPHLGDPAAGEHPVRHRAVHEDQPYADEHRVRAELQAVSGRTGDQRRRDDRERHLERAEEDERDRQDAEELTSALPLVHVLQPDVVEVPDPPAVPDVPERQREHDRHPEDREDVPWRRCSA